MSKGRVVEQGSHDELIARQSVYYDLVQQQSLQAEEEAAQAGIYDSEVVAVSETRTETKEKIRMANSYEAERMPLQHLGGHSKNAENSLFELFRFVFNLHRNDTGMIAGGLLFSILAGASHPV
jgi:ATP-binding cassette subfamily B (MDR/TAP) protein 1